MLTFEPHLNGLEELTFSAAHYFAMQCTNTDIATRSTIATMGQNYSYSQACDMERQRSNSNKHWNAAEAETTSADLKGPERAQSEAQVVERNNTQSQKSSTLPQNISEAVAPSSIPQMPATASPGQNRTTFFSLPFELRNNIYDLISDPPTDRAFHTNFRKSYQKDQFALTAVSRQFREDVLARYYRNVKVVIWSARCGDLEAKRAQDEWLIIGGKHIEAARKFQFHVGVGCVITFEGARGSGVKFFEVEKLIDGLSPVEKRLIEERVARNEEMALKSEDIRDLMGLLEAMQGGGPGWS
ncbi:hypothetical protein AC579_1196 [Pseudocercospora musae]|uniref:F-box domain-containing protein n=1 Tax=Pseudocercospora musae TaxID=113226 RepID=A0A139I6Z8_9PEZI|nr:hypothetical protein AC579_1196 [Pseudocercospora musae]